MVRTLEWAIARERQLAALDDRTEQHVARGAAFAEALDMLHATGTTDAPHGSCIAVDLLEHGPGADERLDPDAVGRRAILTCHLEEGAVALDISGGLGDRRVLVHGDALRTALADAGVPWAAVPRRAPVWDRLRKARSPR